MILTAAKTLIGRMPASVQRRLRRLKIEYDARFGVYHAGEPEFDLLPDLLGPGDFAVDVGANIGHYTVRFSQLVGAHGRVFAFEPVPETAWLLARVLDVKSIENVTLVVAAASNANGSAILRIPRSTSGGRNFYRAQLSTMEPSPDFYNSSCWTVELDSLLHSLPTLSLLKVDAEGADSDVLAGSAALIERCRPVLIVEQTSAETLRWIRSLGYNVYRLKGSPNAIYVHELDERRHSAVEVIAERVV